MADLPTMPLYTDALLSDAGDLPNALFGAYVRLLCRWWREGALPEPNEKRLARWSGLTSAEFDDLKEFLTETHAGWTQKKLFETFARQLEKSIKAKNAAKAKHGSADAGDIMSERIAAAYAARMPSMNHEPFSISKDIGSAQKMRACDDVKDQDDFEKKFWALYPRRRQAGGKLTRGSKIRARKEWTQMGADLREAALAGLGAYASDHPDRSIGVVDAERYLRDQRWRDGEDAETAAGESAGAAHGSANGAIEIAFPEDEGERAFAQALIKRFGPARYGSWFQREGAPLIRKNGTGFYLDASGARRDMIEQRYWPTLCDIAASLGSEISRADPVKEA